MSPARHGPGLGPHVLAASLAPARGPRSARDGRSSTKPAGGMPAPVRPAEPGLWGCPGRNGPAARSMGSPVDQVARTAGRPDNPSCGKPMLAGPCQKGRSAKLARELAGQPNMPTCQRRAPEFRRRVLTFPPCRGSVVSCRNEHQGYAAFILRTSSTASGHASPPVRRGESVCECQTGPDILLSDLVNRNYWQSLTQLMHTQLIQYLCILAPCGAFIHDA